MKILIVAATTMEIAPLMETLKSQTTEKQPQICITGVGMVNTAFTLGKLFATEKFDFAINLGIAGAFDQAIPLGEVLEIGSDCFADMGVEDDEIFLRLDEVNLQNPNEFPFSQGKLQGIHVKPTGLNKVSGITVNKVHGNQNSIDRILKKYNPDTESMEGAAFMFACLKSNVPCVQIRSISNYIEKRDRSKWEVPLAIKQLNLFAVEYLKRMN